MKWTILILLLIFPEWAVASTALFEKLNQSCPQWMIDQIQHDLAPFKNLRIPLSEIDDFFHQISKPNFVCKFQIKSNKVYLTCHFSKTENADYRMNEYLKAFEDIAKLVDLPDVTFFLFLHDGLHLNWPTNWHHKWDYSNGAFPMFLFSAHGTTEDYPVICIPDFEALSEKYQVLSNGDITHFSFPWIKKKNCMIWRGTTNQTGWDPSTNSSLSCAYLAKENLHKYTRFSLCRKSLEHPDLINAKFTITSRQDLLPYMNELFGDHIPYEIQMRYKYHIMINGNGASFSNSGWRFFTNSVVFLPDDHWKQWYYSALQPYVHFIPVKDNLDDLEEKILWAKNHEKECEEIAKNAMHFARSNLTRNDHLIYLYNLIVAYSQIDVFCEE